MKWFFPCRDTKKEDSHSRLCYFVSLHSHNCFTWHLTEFIRMVILYVRGIKVRFMYFYWVHIFVMDALAIKYSDLENESMITIKNLDPLVNLKLSIHKNMKSTKEKKLTFGSQCRSLIWCPNKLIFYFLVKVEMWGIRPTVHMYWQSTDMIAVYYPD